MHIRLLNHDFCFVDKKEKNVVFSVGENGNSVESDGIQETPDNEKKINVFSNEPNHISKSHFATVETNISPKTKSPVNIYYKRTSIPSRESDPQLSKSPLSFSSDHYRNSIGSWKGSSDHNDKHSSLSSVETGQPITVHDTDSSILSDVDISVQKVNGDMSSNSVAKQTVSGDPVDIPKHELREPPHRNDLGSGDENMPPAAENEMNRNISGDKDLSKTLNLPIPADASSDDKPGSLHSRESSHSAPITTASLDQSSDPVKPLPLVSNDQQKITEQTLTTSQVSSASLDPILTQVIGNADKAEVSLSDIKAQNLISSETIVAFPEATDSITSSKPQPLVSTEQDQRSPQVTPHTSITDGNQDLTLTLTLDKQDEHETAVVTDNSEKLVSSEPAVVLSENVVSGGIDKPHTLVGPERTTISQSNVVAEQVNSFVKPDTLDSNVSHRMESAPTESVFTSTPAHPPMKRARSITDSMAEAETTQLVSEGAILLDGETSPEEIIQSPELSDQGSTHTNASSLNNSAVYQSFNAESGIGKSLKRDTPGSRSLPRPSTIATSIGNRNSSFENRRVYHRVGSAHSGSLTRMSSRGSTKQRVSVVALWCIFYVILI